MGAIANLAVSVTANTRGLSKGLRRGRRSLADFGKGVRRIAAGMGALFAGGAGVVGFTALVKNSLQSADALAKTSDKLGLATEKLAGLQHAAELTGAGTRTLDMGLQRMTRRVSEAAQGTGEAQGRCVSWAWMPGSWPSSRSINNSAKSPRRWRRSRTSRTGCGWGSSCSIRKAWR
jgi:hypothetical protein